MKHYLFIILSLVTSVAIAQIPGSKVDGPVKLSNGLSVKEGDTLYLGKGSDNRKGDFVFIYQPANIWSGTPDYNLAKSFANSEVTIKHFKQFKSKKTGEKIFAVINIGGFNQAVEIDAAIETGEIVRINSTNVGPAAKTVKIEGGAPVSVADELKKLKELLDQGILTQAEFDAQKKKLLEKQ